MTDPSLVPFDLDQFNGSSDEDFLVEEEDTEDELAEDGADAGKPSDKGKVPDTGTGIITEEVAPVDVLVPIFEGVEATGQPETAG